MAEKKEKVKKEDRMKIGGTFFKIILVILLILIVASLGFVGYMLASKKTPVVISNTTAVDSTVTASNASPYTYSLDEFLVNLADNGGKSYLKIKVSLGYDAKNKKDMDKELAAKTDQIRDAIIGVLRSKLSTDLNTQTGVDQLKKDILAKVNPLFESGKANSVYINDILIQ
jgi:flagellar basal body-associated protein FliL